MVAPTHFAKMVALLYILGMLQRPVTSAYDPFDTRCTSPNCDINEDNEDSKKGVKICAYDIEDGDRVPLSKCFLDCHKNMKAAEDQATCFYEFCKTKDNNKDFCKELYGGHIKSTECELARSGDAKFRSKMYCKKGNCPENIRKLGWC